MAIVALFFRMMLHSYLHIIGQQSVYEEDSFAFFHWMWSFNCSQITSVFWIVRARLEKDLTDCFHLSFLDQEKLHFTM